MRNKEEKAKAYAKSVSHGRLVIQDFVECAFMVGWDCALKSQWISVKDALPDVGISVLVLTSNGKVSMSKRYQPKDCRGNDVGIIRWKGSSTFENSIVAWMPIPSFDEILKDNKDVLERLKD